MYQSVGESFFHHQMISSSPFPRHPYPLHFQTQHRRDHYDSNITRHKRNDTEAVICAIGLVGTVPKLYRAFYKHVVRRMPDRPVEAFGGLAFKAMSAFSRPANIGFELFGVRFPGVFGLASGWADSRGKIASLYKLGAGIVVAKTLTLEPRKGNPFPRLMRGSNYLVNSMGLPNPGVDEWARQASRSRTRLDRPYLTSIKGDTVEEWVELVDRSAPFSRILELNLSCPNVRSGIIDLKQTADLVRDVSSITDLPVVAKLSPEYPDKQILALMSKIREYVAGVSLFNTVPVNCDRLGNPLGVAGLSGEAVSPSFFRRLQMIRHEFPRWGDYPILGSGGLVHPHLAALAFLKLGVVPLTLTGFLMYGPSIFGRAHGLIADGVRRNGHHSATAFLEDFAFRQA